MKRFTFSVVIEGGDSDDEFWEELEKDGKTGCEEITESVRDALEGTSFDFTLHLDKYERIDG